MTVSAILLSGGKGTRMGSPTPKQYLSLNGKQIALYSLELFLTSSSLSEIIVVCEKEFDSLFLQYSKDLLFARPGKRRQDSLFNGLQKVSSTSNLVLVHDAARPLLTKEDLNAVIEAALVYGAATLGSPVVSTIKQTNAQQIVLHTLPRASLYTIHTPQVVRKEILHQGFERAIQNDLTVTDDVSLAELIGHPVKIVTSTSQNIKITHAEDLLIVEQLLATKAIFA